MDRESVVRPYFLRNYIMSWFPKADNQMTDEAILYGYALKPVATVAIADRRFVITPTDPETLSLEKCVYAFLVGGKITRIGSSKGILRTRFKAWERDVSNSIAGLKSPTPPAEADAWVKLLGEHRGGVIFARQGTLVATPVGEFNAYMDEESVLLGRHRPPQNRSFHR